jgi:hypothetical protein
MSVSGLMAQMPRDLQLRIAELHAQGEIAEIRQVSYKDGTSCAAIIGLSPKGKKVAFVTLQYTTNNDFKWAPFASVPFDEQNDTFGLHSDGKKVLVLQSNSKINHANTIGFHVELNPTTKLVVLRLIELGSFRMPSEEVAECLAF